ncbi:MAG: transposase, partial [Candidatus Rokubacteria bacterium]|nr:transposase [Candidatus Rokubacteria bacterium]
ATRGYSRDHRPDCKQVVVGLVLDRDGFPKAHEVFDGNRVDRTTVADMLTALEQRTGRRAGATVVVDRGMAYADNLQEITDRGYHYLVAGRQPERMPHLDAFEDETGWAEVLRQPSPRNPAQKKSRVEIKRQVVGAEVHILCRSEGRTEKDRAIREKHEQRFLDQGVHTSWATLREQRSTHQVVTVVLPATNGQTLRIRKGSTPDALHREIYRTLAIPHEVMTPVRIWAPTPSP